MLPSGAETYIHASGQQPRALNRITLDVLTIPDQKTEYGVKNNHRDKQRESQLNEPLKVKAREPDLPTKAPPESGI